MSDLNPGGLSQAFVPCGRCGKLVQRGDGHDCTGEEKEARDVADMALAGWRLADMERQATYYEREFRRAAKRAEGYPATKAKKREKMKARAVLMFRNAIFYRRFYEDYADTHRPDALARDLEEPRMTLERWREAILRMHYAAQEGATHPSRVDEAVRIATSERAGQR